MKVVLEYVLNLMPLLECDFEIVSYADLKIASNCCVYLGRVQHYYIVPYQHISKTAHVVWMVIGNRR